MNDRTEERFNVSKNWSFLTFTNDKTAVGVSKIIFQVIHDLVVGKKMVLLPFKI